MKTSSSKRRELSDDLEAEYSLDYSNGKSNPYAARLKGRSVAVVLDPDVASVFRTSEAVNTLLRSVAAAVPRRSAKKPPNEALTNSDPSHAREAFRRRRYRHDEEGQARGATGRSSLE